MEEHQVTIEGETRLLPTPFFVIATQNPSYQVGTFPLPESQLDRFLMRIQLGYPDRDAERGLLSGIERREIISTLRPCMETAELQTMQEKVREVHVSSALLDYIQAIISYTRLSPTYIHGMSPRAGLALLSSARAWALMDKRNQVLPEDVQAVLPGVIGHRLHSTGDHTHNNSADLVENIIREVAIP